MEKVEENSGVLYTIQDVKVKFPFEAYPLQLNIMENIIKSLVNKENCLLESPTGSGKTLAFLCAALAWQKQQQLVLQEDNVLPTVEEENLLGEPKRPRLSGDKKTRNVSKIFYCTRTHKQIKQVIQELAKTNFHNVKMCILSSRDKTCIHSEISKLDKNKDEACQKLLKDPEGFKCHYFSPTHLLDHKMIEEEEISYAWDLEDIISLGKIICVCPYFGLWQLKESSDIIFCPYNYVIDPLIRSQLKINLHDQIIILDEGHNVEDCAREFCSFTVDQDTLKKVLNNLEDKNKFDGHEKSKQFFARIISGMLTWIVSHGKKLDISQNNGKIISGSEIVDLMTEIGAGKNDLQFLQSLAKTLGGDNNDYIRERFNQPDISSESLQVITELLNTLKFLYCCDLKYVQDYHGVLVEKKTDYTSQNSRKKIKKNLSLNFWCMNPAVCFSEFKNVHSLIISSGTLSPLSSFQTELSIDFKNMFQANNHLLKKSQVWVGTIRSGPKNYPLKAIFQNTESREFQDELGETILQICYTVSFGGILCFFPSYNNLEKMKSRWELTGLLKKIQKIKFLAIEPRQNTKETDFDEILASFYSAVKNFKSDDNKNQSGGALFLAVFRGKVSEGINFSDDNARAVITIGIPFPNIKDLQIDLKRKYNNERSSSLELLNGHEWYEAQAFRPLNQALGRCIRHKNDWGALILIDQRFQINRSYIKSLSKWIRQEICHYRTLSSAMSSLDSFINSNHVQNVYV